MKAKQSINALLARATGYRLTRATSTGGATPPGPRSGTASRPAKGGGGERPAGGGGARRKRAGFPPDYDEADREIIRAVRPYTMTGHDKLHALITATRYVHAHRVPGAIMECGVWRGGSMHAVARTLDELGDHSRELYLFDTFEGMPPPTEKDKRWDGKGADVLLNATDRGSRVWAVASLEDVRDGVATLPYPADRFHYAKGMVEDTIPDQAPESIAILRLDTDWYESTRHELEHLYPRLVSGGVLILDDFGHWQGARQAAEEYFAKTDEPIMLTRAGSGRIGVKR